MFESWATLLELSRARQQDILARAQMGRLLAGGQKPGNVSVRLRWRLRTWLGRGLVALGSRMQEAERRAEAARDLRKAG